MEGRLQTILALLIRAKYCGKPEAKVGLLTDANVELEVLRFQVRWARFEGAAGRATDRRCADGTGRLSGGRLAARRGRSHETSGRLVGAGRPLGQLAAGGAEGPARRARPGRGGMLQLFAMGCSWHLQRELWTAGIRRAVPFALDRPAEAAADLGRAVPRPRVHHALMIALEPALDRQLHPYSYACRKGKGTHAAGDRLQFLAAPPLLRPASTLKFFPSIDTHPQISSSPPGRGRSPRAPGPHHRPLQ